MHVHRTCSVSLNLSMSHLKVESEDVRSSHPPGKPYLPAILLELGRFFIYNIHVAINLKNDRLNYELF